MNKTITFNIFILLFFLSAHLTYSQANAGDDKLICTGANVIIGEGTENPDYCYSWNPTQGLDNPHILHPTANPTAETTYTLTVVGPNFSSKSTDQMKVYVDIPVTLKVEEDLTECMEGRSLTFTAEAKTDYPLPTGTLVKFTFHFQDPAGVAWTEEEWSIDKVETVTVVAGDVLPNDADHKFTSPVYVEAEIDGCVGTSPTLNIDVYELYIDYVRHSVGKEWKAVIGENIAYKAFASSDCQNWDWDMEDGVPDAWNPTGGDAKSGNMLIPYTDQARASNSWFGDVYGTVGVFCEDGEGNNHTFNSTDMTPAKKVKVFFDPEKNVDGGAPSTAKPPCWFVFWKDGNVVQDMNICGYDHTLDFGQWWTTSGLELGPLAGTVNSGPESLTNMSGVVFTMTGSGKHLLCVAETMTHELYHKFAIEGWGHWLVTGPGFDDTDGLPNGEEDVPHKTQFHKSDSTNHNTFNYALYATDGYADQEVRCRIEEIGTGVKATYPAKDWSKDIENPHWKN